LIDRDCDHLRVQDAAIAAQVKLHPEDGHQFQVQEAPGPEEVNPLINFRSGDDWLL